MRIGISGKSVGDYACCVQAAHLGHLEVEHYEVRPNLAKAFNRFLTVSSLITDPPVIMLFKNSAKIPPDGRIVVHYENANNVLLLNQPRTHEQRPI